MEGWKTDRIQIEYHESAFNVFVSFSDAANSLNRACAVKGRNIDADEFKTIREGKASFREGEELIPATERRWEKMTVGTELFPMSTV